MSRGRRGSFVSRHDDEVRLRHMLDHAVEAVELARDRTREDLGRERMLNVPPTRPIEVMGEAAARVSADGRERTPKIPWTEIVSLRNRIVHGYDNVNFDILWTIVKHDLSPLIESPKRVLRETE